MKKIKIFLVVLVYLLAIIQTKCYASDKTIEIQSTYEDGEVIILYESSMLTSAKMKVSSLTESWSIEYTVDFENISTSNISALAGTSDEEQLVDLKISLVKSEEYSTDELVEKLNEKNWVIYAIPNYKISATSLTNDEYSDFQWSLDNNEQNGGEEGIDISPVETSSEDEKVIAVVDTGIDYTHEDLKNVMWTNTYSTSDLAGTYGYDFANSDDDPMDDNSHGTHVAGIIAAEANNETGISGVTLRSIKYKANGT